MTTITEYNLLSVYGFWKVLLKSIFLFVNEKSPNHSDTKSATYFSKFTLFYFMMCFKIISLHSLTPLPKCSCWATIRSTLNKGSTCLHRFFKNRYFFLKESKFTCQLEEKQSIANNLSDHRSFYLYCDKD